MTNCSCLCGEIEFEVVSLPEMTFNCHCSRCKKSHGSAFSTQVLADKKSLTFLKGRELLSEYESTEAIRAFCSKCGSRLINYDKGHGNYLSVALSAINDPKEYRLAGECFVQQKYDFVELNNSVAHYEKLPGGI